MSMGVYSDGSYGIPEGLIYSFPVTCEKGEWSIVKGKFSSPFLLFQIIKSHTGMFVHIKT